MGLISDSIRKALQEAWDRPQRAAEDVWYYQRVLGTKFVEFVEKFEDVALKRLVERIVKLEAAVFAQEEQAQTPVEGQNGNGNGNGKHAAPAADTAGMVRLDSQNKPMSPEEQKTEEEADLKIYGKIDESRYVPRNAVQG